MGKKKIELSEEEQQEAQMEEEANQLEADDMNDDDDYNEVAEVFNSFAHSDGVMYKKSLARALQSLGFYFNAKELRELIRGHDEDQSGSLDGRGVLQSCHTVK